MAKDHFLQIRLTKEDKARLAEAAEAAYLTPSTWARQAVLSAIEKWEQSVLAKKARQDTRPLRVAERKN